MLTSQYGGQAVIEGVMIRGKKNYAIAVRGPDKDIKVELSQVGSLAERFTFLKWPILRGVLALFESLSLGLRALSYSASQAVDEEEELSTGQIILTMITAFLLAVGIFVFLPAYLIRFISSYIDHYLLLNLVEGSIKVLFLVFYILAISRLSDIRRVFEYHGAEHKIIHAYENLSQLDISAARRFSPQHPRCGSSFLLVVIVISVLLFSFFGRPHFLMRVVIHMSILPLVAGLSYEFIKMAGRKKDSKFLRLLSLPGLTLQRLTTREPDDEQLEVALEALKNVLKAENSTPALD